MNSLFFSFDMKVEKAYIIRVSGNKTSEAAAARCAESCKSIGMNYEFWDAYDGIDGPIKPPAHHNDVMKMIKIMDHYMTRGEVACALSHISLWAKCVIDDKPLVVLEHDAIMLAPYENHAVYNSVCYLGGYEQVKKGWPVLPTPPHGTDGPNNHFIARAHAYAIDPAVAKNMLSHVIKYGITDPLDFIIRADLFPMHQIGICGYDMGAGRDESVDTTISGRPKQGRTFIRNDKLER